MYTPFIPIKSYAFYAVNRICKNVARICKNV